MAKGKMIRRCSAYTPRIKALGYTKIHWANMHGNVKKDRLTSLCVSELIRLYKQGFPFEGDGTVSAIADNPIIKKAHYWGRYYLACAIASNRIWREKIPLTRVDLYYLESTVQDRIYETHRTYQFLGLDSDPLKGPAEWGYFDVYVKGKTQRYINPKPSKKTELYLLKLFGPSTEEQP
jgi:hypothetical protein